MVEIGKKGRLRVVKKVDFGVYLDGGELGEILLPTRYLPASCEVDDEVDVFVYRDSEDLVIATTEQPFAEVGECAYLKVVDVNPHGAFLDWGLSKDLLVPFSEQAKPMEKGKSYVVYLYLDDRTHRIAASSKLNTFLSEAGHYFKSGQAVDLMIYTRTDLGYKAIINGTHLGLLFENEVFQPLKIGQKVQGFIKTIRPDKKIDLTLQLPGTGSKTRDELMERILDYLRAHDGVSELTDKSSPESIYRQYGVSKANYKKALGRLYKQKLIRIEKNKITLLPAEG